MSKKQEAAVKPVQQLAIVLSDIPALAPMGTKPGVEHATGVFVPWVGTEANVKELVIELEDKAAALRAKVLANGHVLTDDECRDLGGAAEWAKAQAASIAIGGVQKVGADMVGRMRQTVAYLHHAKLMPKQIKVVLQGMGFPPSRISEFTKISLTSPAVVKKFLLGESGYMATLKEARMADGGVGGQGKKQTAAASQSSVGPTPRAGMPMGGDSPSAVEDRELLVANSPEVRAALDKAKTLKVLSIKNANEAYAVNPSGVSLAMSEKSTIYGEAKCENPPEMASGSAVLSLNDKGMPDRMRFVIECAHTRIVDGPIYFNLAIAGKIYYIQVSTGPQMAS